MFSEPQKSKTHLACSPPEWVKAMTFEDARLCDVSTSWDAAVVSTHVLQRGDKGGDLTHFQLTDPYRTFKISTKYMKITIIHGLNQFKYSFYPPRTICHPVGEMSYSFSSSMAVNLLSVGSLYTTENSYADTGSPRFVPFICKVLTGTSVHNFLLYTFSQSKCR